MTTYTAPVDTTDVTDEMVTAVRNVLDGWYQTGRIDWPDVWDRVDGTELSNGTRLDLGDSLTTPALRELKRRARAT